ncbi:MAG TPA: hypothetical protein VGI16_13345 [Candidatus Acidoferrum sp.]|jgi:hypothetical protein
MREIHRKIKLQVRFVICLFALLAVSSAGARAQQAPGTSASSGQQTTPASKTPTTFALKIISDGILCPRDNSNCEEQSIWWKRFTILVSDGHTLYLRRIPFPSPARSKQQFDAAIKNAENILRHNIESNSNGDPVGERALGVFPKTKDSKGFSGPPDYKLFCFWGSDYWEIDGEHLEDVIALEQKLKQEGMGTVWHLRPAKVSPMPD